MSARVPSLKEFNETHGILSHEELDREVLESICEKHFGGVSPERIIELLKMHHPENFV